MNIMKIAIFPNVIHRFKAIPTKIPMTFFREINPKLCMKYKRPQIAQIILSIKSSDGGTTVRGFKLYYRAILTKTEWYWQKTRHVVQWNGIEDTEISSHSYAS
jgi:hypothetical protein